MVILFPDVEAMGWQNEPSAHMLWWLWKISVRVQRWRAFAPQNVLLQPWFVPIRDCPNDEKNWWELTGLPTWAPSI